MKTPSRAQGLYRFSVAVMVLTTFIVPELLSAYDYSFNQLCLAMILFDVCLFPMLQYLKHREAGLPVLPLLCVSYAVQFAMPVFTREPIQWANYAPISLKDSDVTSALLLCIVGVAALQIGYKCVRSKRVATLLPSVNIELSVRRMEIFCIFAIVAAIVLRGGQAIFFSRTDQQFASILAFLENQVLVAIGLLGWIVYTGRGKIWHKILLYGTVIGVSGMRGFYTTMLELMLVPIIILFSTKWIYTRRLPVAGLTIVVLLILFLSPVKVKIRSEMEKDVTSASEASDLASSWLGKSLDYWVDSFEGKSLMESTLEATSRTDMIHQFSYMHSMTPEAIPYLYGSSYTYFLVALIPRALWPDKPIATNSTVKFDVDYGFTNEEGSLTTSIGPTLIGEGFINFGLIGVLAVMFLQGVILSVFEQVFAKSVAGVSIFLALFVYLLNGIGGAAAVMFGGILQSLIGGALFLWIFSDKRQSLFVFNRKLRRPALLLRAQR